MDDQLSAACARAVHVVTDEGRVLRAGRAALFVLGLLGWPRLAWLGGSIPLVWLVELAYWVVARNRLFFSMLLFRGP